MKKLRIQSLLPLTCLVACSTAPPAQSPSTATKPPAPAGDLVERAEPSKPEVAYCSAVEARRDVPTCIQQLTLAQVKARPVSYKLTSKDGRIVQKERVNGLLFLEPLAGNVAREEYEYVDERIVGLRRYDRTGRLLFHDLVEQNGVYWWRFDEDALDADDPREAQGLTRQFNDAGYVVSKTYIDSEGNPAGNTSGYERIDYKRDGAGRILEARYFASNGKPSHNREGVHWLKYKIDQFGDAVETRFFDQTGAPTLDRSGIYLQTRKFNEVGVLLSRKYFDMEGKAALGSWGAHEERFEPGENGTAIRTSYFDASGAPVRSTSGYHSYTARFDAEGNAVEWKYFGVLGQPIGVWKKQHTTVRKFEGGLLIEEAMYGIDGEPLKPWQFVYASTRKHYDKTGRLIRTEFFSPDGKLVDNKEGHAVVKQTWDELGRLTSKSFFKPDGSKAESGGFHEKKLAYSKKGLPTFKYFDAKGSAAKAFLFTKVVVRFGKHITRTPPSPALRLMESIRPNSTRTKTLSHDIAEQAFTDLKDGADSTAVALRYGSPPRSPSNTHPSSNLIRLVSELEDEDREELLQLSLGEVSQIKEVGDGFVIYRLDSVY